MDPIIACALCGGDPGTDAMLVQSALAAGISIPYFLRGHIVAAVRRVRHHGAPVKLGEEAAACSYPASDGDQSGD